MKTIKKTIAFILPAFFAASSMLVSSCSGDDSKKTEYVCASCAAAPEALAANDYNAKGIYKGIVVGSTGTISINIQNGSNTIAAVMVLDGITANLVSNVSVVEGETYVAPFTGTYNGSPVSVTFRVGSGGQQPIMVSSDIPGHPDAVFELFKEGSDSLIEAFVGDYTAGGDTGTFNVVVARSLSKWGYIAKEIGTGEINEGSGTIANGNKLLNEEGNVVATINGDIIQGSSSDGNGDTVVIYGERNL